MEKVSYKKIKIKGIIKKLHENNMKKKRRKKKGGKMKEKLEKNVCRVVVPPPPPKRLSSIELFSGPAMGTAQTLI